MGILEEAATIVESVERSTIMERVEALLKKYPQGMALFIISNGDLDDTTIVEASTNTGPMGMLCLMNVAFESVMRGLEPEGE